VYETVARLPAAGEYNLAFLLDSPRITHYFDVTVGSDPKLAKTTKQAVVIEQVGDAPQLVAGRQARIRFRIADATTGAPRDGLDDVTVLAFSPPSWQRRSHAEPFGAGTYTVALTPPHPGAYYLYAESPTVGARLHEHWFLTLDVKAKENEK
jgi:hypothetical protein